MIVAVQPLHQPVKIKGKAVLILCSLLRSRLSGCHATLLRKEGAIGGALRDIPKDGSEGD